MSSSPESVDPLVQIRLSDLLALRAAAANTGAVPVSVTPSHAPVAAAAPAITSPQYLDTKAAAALLGVSVKGLEAMRANGHGPKYIRVGRRVRYLASELGAGTR